MSDPILLVEDSEDDVLFLLRAFKKAGITNPIQVAKDGQEALDYLGRAGQYQNGQKFPLPCLVLLDLKLPHVLGLDVLKWMRMQSQLQTLPVSILTSSSQTVDLERAYRLGANSYLVKPSSPDQLDALVRCLGDYWLKYNLLPTVG